MLGQPLHAPVRVGFGFRVRVMRERECEGSDVEEVSEPGLEVTRDFRVHLVEGVDDHGGGFGESEAHFVEEGVEWRFGFFRRDYYSFG